MKVILISGQQGSGKSALVSGLIDGLKSVTNVGIFKNTPYFPIVEKFSFADVAYECHDSVINVLGNYGIDTKQKEKELVRDIAEWAKERFYKEIWADAAKKKINKIADFFPDKNIIFLNDDLRFKYEFEAIEGIKIRLECSEEIRKERCGENWRKETGHISEVDLNDWVHKFDLVIHTDNLTKEETLTKAVEFLNERISYRARA